jgi:hypothetical protein
VNQRLFGAIGFAIVENILLQIAEGFDYFGSSQ